jgi:hypothetical protein
MNDKNHMYILIETAKEIDKVQFFSGHNLPTKRCRRNVPQQKKD